MARSRAYRWGEDGIAGICDRYQLLVFAFAFWNGCDPILKERMFGLTSNEGNRGEDVKEYYFYLDNLPTHSYMRILYKYPQREFPYGQLVEENRRRQGEREFKLIDTGIFDEDRYFDIVIEYAKGSAEDICIRLEAFNRGPETAELHILPHLWFRNTWAWSNPRGSEPEIRPGPAGKDFVSLLADDSQGPRLDNLQFRYSLGPRYLYVPAGGELLFTDNETNYTRFGEANTTPYVKDAFHRHLIHGEACVNPEQVGTKACASYTRRVPSQTSVVFRMRLTDAETSDPLSTVDAVIAQRKAEADEFYEAIHPPKASAEEKMIQRQAFAGMLWNKQIYLFDVAKWLDGDSIAPPEPHKGIRNVHWRHLNSMRIMTVPDKWEFPWFAAWDLAFQCTTLVAGGSGVRQRESLASAVRTVSAPEWADPGLRMGIFRPESPGPCLGRVARVLQREAADRQRRYCLPGEMCSQAADELRLVGKPCRPRRKQRF